MNRSFQLLPALLATASACTFDATGLTWPPATTDFGDESDSTASVPTTGPDTPTDPGDAASTDAPTTTATESSGPSTTDADTSTSGDATTGSPPAVCGDGVVSGDEECDDGLNENSNDEDCTLDCTRARCGDGHLQAVNGETCDAGYLNSADPQYNGCSMDCTRGPHCGDGEVQAQDGEECEPGNAEGDVETCLATCVYEARVLFLTSVATDGDLDGLAGADKLCNELAEASLLPGSYRAWILLDWQLLAHRFPELALLQSPMNFVNVDGDVLAKSIDGLISTGPAHTIIHDEQGASWPEVLVWTNITSSGAAAGGDCDQWSSIEGFARVGNSGYSPDAGPEAAYWHASRQWTDQKIDLACDNPIAHLYCIQVTA
jgi:hypothetical protein